MLRRLLGELPGWAKSDHPLLRYELQRHEAAPGLRARLLRIVGWGLLLALLVLFGYGYATDWMQRGFQPPYTLDLWRMLFYPVFALQLIFRASGLSLAVGVISAERRRQTWDHLRATETGAENSLRVRWLSIFYRLRMLVGVILIARFTLLLAILYELTSMQGAYLDILANHSQPPVPLLLAIPLLAAFMSALMILPVTAAGVDIALGLLLSSAVRSRSVIGVIQVLVICVRVFTALALLWGMTEWTAGRLVLDSPLSLLLTGTFSLFADWGLTLGQLNQAGQLWADIPGSIFLGVLLLAAGLVQVMISSLLLHLAARASEHFE